MTSLSEMIPLILLMFVAAYVVLRWRESSKDAEEQDPQLGFKSALYALQVFALLILLQGAWRLLDYPLHFLTSSKLHWKALMQALFLVVAGGGLFFGFEVFLGKTNTAEHWLPRKTFYGAAILLVGVNAVASASTWLSGLLTSKGPRWDIPLAQTLVYVPAMFFLVTLYQKLFSTAEGPTGPLAKGLLALGGGGGFEAMAADSGAGMPAAGAPVDAQAAQPSFPSSPAQPAEQPVAQPAGLGAAASPAAGAPAQPQAGGGADNCPTCGNPTRFIQQYNRTWCDTCQRYL
jgi:hypothetical protein